MHQLFRFFLLVFCCILIVNSEAQNQPVNTGAYRCSQRKTGSGNLVKKPFQSASAPVHSFNVLKYTLNLDISSCYDSPYPKNFSGSVIIDFKADSSINHIKLDAVNSSLIIDSVRLNGVSFTHANDILNIQLNTTYLPGQNASVKIYYRHQNVTDNAFYANGGFVFTDCEPEGARKWFPCWDKPADKAKVDITAKVKSNVRLGANGYLADSLLNGNYLTYHWISPQEVATYLVVLTSKVNYHLKITHWPLPSNPAVQVPFRFYYNDGEDPTPVTSVINAMASWYSEHFAEHPFDKNGFATLNSDFAWGGMENQTLTSLCPNCWDEGLAAHEFAHQWFGDMITCGTWADIWLNEGFATWSEAYWYESYGGYNQYKTTINDAANYYLATNPGWAISVPDWAVTTPSLDILFNYSITYEKGACVLHQLRYVLGDSLFFAVLHEYCADLNLKFGAATIPDFASKVNLVTGSDYSWFFNEWIYQPDHPLYQNTYNFQNLGNNQWKINFFTKQTQTTTGFFKMPVELNFRFADGSDTTVKFMNDVNNQSLWWFVNKQPIMVFFDPSRQIVLKNASTIVGINPLQDNQELVTLKVIPNPVRTEAKICYSSDKYSEVKLSVTDLRGNLMFEINSGPAAPGNYETGFDSGKLSAGTYICTLVAGSQVKHEKFIIIR